MTRNWPGTLARISIYGRVIRDFPDKWAAYGRYVLAMGVLAVICARFMLVMRAFMRYVGNSYRVPLPVPTCWT